MRQLGYTYCEDGDSNHFACSMEEMEKEREYNSCIWNVAWLEHTQSELAGGVSFLHDAPLLKVTTEACLSVNTHMHTPVDVWPVMHTTAKGALTSIHSSSDVHPPHGLDLIEIIQCDAPSQPRPFLQLKGGQNIKQQLCSPFSLSSPWTLPHAHCSSVLDGQHG